MAEPRAHEHGDVRLTWVLIAVAALTATAVTIHLALFGLQWAFMRLGGTAGQEPSQPAPPMHLHQRAETDAIQRAGEARLAGGKVPLDRAIDMVVRRGWATPRPAAAAPRGGRP